MRRPQAMQRPAATPAPAEQTVVNPAAGGGGFYGQQAGAPSAAPAAPAAAPRTAQPTNYRQWESTPVGSRAQQGTNPYNANMPRYDGLDDQDIAWANTAVNAKRPDGSFAYTKDQRNHAQRQVLDKQRTQDRELTDPMSGTSLRARMGAFTDDLGGMRGNAATQMEKYGGVYDANDAASEGRIGRLDSWNPDEQANMDLSFIKNQRPDAQNAWTPGKLGSFDSTETRGWRASNLGQVDTSGLRGYNAGGAMESYLSRNGGGSYDTTAQAGTSSYDPRAAVEEYARGASMAAQPMLADQLEAEANAAARSGRLNTGLFDKDKGSVIRRVGENLNAGILQKSVDAAGIRAQIENANSRNITDANIAGLRERGNMAGLRSAEARDASRLGLDAIDAATGYDTDIADSMDRLSLDQAGMIDKNALTAADATARYTLDQAQGIDDFNQKGAISFGELDLKRRSGIDDSRYGARRDAADASIRRQNTNLNRLDLSQQLWGDASGMYGDAISGERDRITGRENFDRDMKQREKERITNFWGGMARGGASVAAAGAG